MNYNLLESINAILEAMYILAPIAIIIIGIIIIAKLSDIHTAQIMIYDSVKRNDTKKDSTETPEK